MAFAMISRARNLLLWIITHYLGVSSFWWLKLYAPSSDRKQQAYHHHQWHKRHHLWCSLVILLFAPSFLNLQESTFCHAVGYSYARFVGPVSGPEHEIIVHDELNGGTRVDYVARPEYQFAYGVEDSQTHVLQNRKETRDGDAVKGVYSVVDPDGTLRVVKYTADDLNGFQAEVITDGVAIIHGQNDDGSSSGNVANNGFNRDVSTGNAIHHTSEHDNNAETDASDNQADDYDGDSKRDYEVYEEQKETDDSVDEDRTTENDASVEGSYEDNVGGYEENSSDNDYY